MNNFEKQTITIHISYIDEMTLYAMEDSLHLLNEALNVFSKEFEIVMSETSPSLVLWAKYQKYLNNVLSLFEPKEKRDYENLEKVISLLKLDCFYIDAK